MTEKGRELRELVAKWRERSQRKLVAAHPFSSTEARQIDQCIDELEAALAKQTPAPRELGQAQAWGERIGRIEAFKEASRHKYSHGRIGSACACGVRFEGNADREWPAHIESLAGEQTPAPREPQQEPKTMTNRELSETLAPRAIQDEVFRSEPAAQQTPHAAGQDALREACKRIKARMQAIGREVFLARDSWQKELEAALDEELAALSQTSTAPGAARE